VYTVKALCEAIGEAMPCSAEKSLVVADGAGAGGAAVVRGRRAGVLLLLLLLACFGAEGRGGIMGFGRLCSGCAAYRCPVCADESLVGRRPWTGFVSLLWFALRASRPDGRALGRSFSIH